MVAKNFDEWNLNKKEIQNKLYQGVKLNAREVWWCAIGINIGNEQDGVGEKFERPVLILKKLSPTTFIVIPLSTKERLASFQVKVSVNDKLGFALLDQIKVIDVKRFLRKMGYIQKSEYEEVVNKFKALL